MNDKNTTTDVNDESIHQSHPINQNNNNFVEVYYPDSFMAEINGCRFLIEVHFSNKSKMTLSDKLIRINDG